MKNYSMLSALMAGVIFAFIFLLVMTIAFGICCVVTWGVSIVLGWEFNAQLAFVMWMVGSVSFCIGLLCIDIAKKHSPKSTSE